MTRPSTRLSLTATLVTVLSLPMASGCRLNADDIRELVKNPTGSVTSQAMQRVASGAVVSDVATNSESVAYTFKALAEADLDKFDAADAFCVGSLAADTADFAACSEGENCEAELTVDSCLLRVGDADPDAWGKLRFKLKNLVESKRQELHTSINFEDWEASRDDDTTTDLFKGLVELEATHFEDDDELESEVIFTSDVEHIVRRKERGLFFDDGHEDYRHAIAGLRATVQAGEDAANGLLEIVTFVDADGGRDEAVVLRLVAEGHEVDHERIAGTVDLEVQGQNGTFRCNFSEIDADSSRDGLQVKSAGSCTDEDGDVFEFDGEVVER